jgi:hypothetical protein
MALITKQPTSNTTPDPAQGGIAVTTPSNTGHAATTASQVGAGSQTKSCLWTTIGAGPGGTLTSVTLKVDWSENGAIANGGANGFRIQRSIDGGGAWTDVFNHLNVTSSTTSTSQVALSTSQDLTLVQVRVRLQASGSGVGDSGSVTASVSNIRIEVVTAAGASVIVAMM